MKWLSVLALLSVFSSTCFCRKHELEITNDARRYFALSTFGFFPEGKLEVNMQDFKITPFNENATIGFSLDRTINQARNDYLEHYEAGCVLKSGNLNQQNNFIIYLTLDLHKQKMNLGCHGENIRIFQNPQASFGSCKNVSFDITSKTIGKDVFFNASFVMEVGNEAEGLYNLYFHNCLNYEAGPESLVDFKIEIIERNSQNYLSAGEIPLPALYCMMSILFLLSGMFWVFLLKQSKHPVFKIHYMMAVLVFLKAISLAFHGVNYHYIETLGVHMATWAILFYVAHLLKGALLFVVIVLIGTGWTFIKHVLAPRDKRLFMTIIPLQVLANIADIIMEESEEGAREYWAWRAVAVVVDLICCGCISFPVVWSIRHLQEASQTSGKAASNLRKLKLFQHFYVMIIGYIYTTRIIVNFLKFSVPFQYSWLHEMFKEMATYVFFVLTAYKFRPASHNPYFALEDDDDDDEAEVITKYCASDGLRKVNCGVTGVHKKTHSTMTEVTEEEKDALLAQRESSHEYD